MRKDHGGLVLVKSEGVYPLILFSKVRAAHVERAVRACNGERVNYDEGVVVVINGVVEIVKREISRKLGYVLTEVVAVAAYVNDGVRRARNVSKTVEHGCDGICIVVYSAGVAVGDNERGARSERRNCRGNGLLGIVRRA